MSEVRKSDVLVVGSGSVGNAAAYFLAKAGLSVNVLEKETVGNGSSTRNGGLNKMNFRGVPELSIAMYGVEDIWPMLQEDLQKEVGVDIEYETTGGYRCAATDEEMKKLKTFIPHAEKENMHLEFIDGMELRKRIPQFSEKVVGASYCAEEGRANPLKTTLGLYSAARDFGAKFYDNEKAIQIDLVKGAARRVVTEQGNVYEADHIIVAACYGSRELLNTVDIDIPFTHALCEVFVTEPVPIFMKEIVISSTGAYYGHQTAHGSLVFGAGSKFGPFSREGTYVEKRLTSQMIPSGAKGLMEVFPFLEKTKIIRSWSGWHDRTPDDTTCLEAIEEVPGLYIACGFSGHGFGIAAPVGKVLSEMVMGEPLGADISQLRFDRFLPMDPFTGADRVKY
ncbi:MAG: FAD-binding oxidoreductase [Anaerostipes sp.]|nr:FAD-binding oxidoreductase [Anaerostipes sp.]